MKTKSQIADELRQLRAINTRSYNESQLKDLNQQIEALVTAYWDAPVDETKEG